MKSFFNKDSYTIHDIHGLISTQAEEGYYLEFKDSRALSTDNEAKVEISRDISAFANSDGGILIYGLSEKKGRANKISWIENPIFTKEWLQQVIDSKITRRLQELVIIPIDNPDNISQQIFVLKIGASAQAPHMANDNCYYERDNKGKRKMMEHQVREMYFRTGKTDLELHEVRGRSGMPCHPHNGKPTTIKFSIEFFIKNIGATIENNFKLEVQTPSILSRRKSYIGNHNEFYEREEGGDKIFTFGSKTPLYQTEIFPTGEISIEITPQLYHHFENGVLNMKLYYSSGIKEYNHNLLEYLTLDDKKILKEDMSVYP